jgi:hypothetical protein
MNRLPLLILSLLLLSCNPTPPQSTPTTEILLVRTDHRYPDDLPEDFSKTIQEIVNFQPEVFFSESLHPNDKIGISNFYKFRNKLISYLLSKNNIQLCYIDEEINVFRKKLSLSPEDIPTRAKLLRALWMNYDIGNSRYEAHKLSRLLQSIPRGEDRDSMTSYISREIISMDTVKKYLLNKPQGEYAKIAFPAAMKLNLESFYPMDNHDDALAFQKNWTLAADGYQNEEWKKIMEEYNSYFKKAKQKGEYVKALNTEYTDRMDSLVYAVPKKYSKNKKAAILYEKYWEYRNQKMVENIIRKIEADKISKAAVIVGASHGRLMKQYLEERGYKILDIHQEKI